MVIVYASSQIFDKILSNNTVQDLESIADEGYNIIVANPILSILVFVFLFGVGVFGGIYITRYLRSESSEFLDVIKDCDKISVLMHNNPDPDAMACAMGVKHLARKVDTDTEILYPGRISHDENRAFRAVLDVSFDNISNVEEITGDKIVLVDHNVSRGLNNGDTLIPDAIIDHHSQQQFNESKVEYTYIDESIGSCSSIITRFLDEQDMIDSNDDNEISDNLATALYYGIKSDTNDFSRNLSDLDFSSINILYPHIDKDDLHRISNPKADSSSLETKARAIMGREIRSPFGISDVGMVENPDSIPQAADELIRLEGLSAVAVIGLCNDSLRISARAYDDRIHLGNALREIIEEIPGSNGGGHANMAGAQIPLKSMQNKDLTNKDIINRIFECFEGF